MTEEEKKAAEVAQPMGLPSGGAASDLLAQFTNPGPDQSAPQSSTPSVGFKGTSDDDLAKFTGAVGTVLNVINRPFSAVVGTIDAVDNAAMNQMPLSLFRSKDAAPNEHYLPIQAGLNAFNALVHGKTFSFGQQIERRDIPLVDVPEPLRVLAGIATDIAVGSFIDPIGKMKILGELDDGSRALLSVKGTSILPKAVDELGVGAIRKTADTAIKAVTLGKFSSYREVADTISDMYQTQRKVEDKYGDFFNWLKSEAYDLDKGLKTKEEAMTAMRDTFAERGLPESLYNFAFAALENPSIVQDGATIKRVVAAKSSEALHGFAKDLITKRIAEIDNDILDPLNRNVVATPKMTTGPAIPADKLTQDLAAKFDKSYLDSVVSSAQKQQEIELGLQSRLGELMTKKQAGVQGLDKDIQYLWNHLDAIDAMRPNPSDPPVQYVQNAMRIAALHERDALASAFKGGNQSAGKAAASLLDRAGIEKFYDIEQIKAVDVFGNDVVMSPDAQEVVATLLPWQKYAQSLYAEAHKIAGAANPKLPFENYMKHMRTDGALALYPKGWTKEQRFADVFEDFKRKFYSAGADEITATQMANSMTAKLLQGQSGKAAKLSRAEQRGIFEPMLGRKIDLDAVEINNSDLGFKVSTNPFDVTNRMVQDAERFKYATGVYKQAIDSHGIDKQAFDLLTPAQQKTFVPVDFRLKFLPEGAKDPFNGKYLPRDFNEALQANLGMYRMFTTHEGLNKFVSFLDSFRKAFTGSTLILFPGKWVRDFTGSYMNAAAGDTHLMSKTGSLAYGTAANMFGKDFGRGIGHVVDLNDAQAATLSRLNELFPGSDFDAEKLRKMLYISDLTSTHNFRDIGIANAAQQTIGLTGQTRADAVKKLAKDFLQDLNPLNQGDTARSPLVRAMNPVNYFKPERFGSNPVYNFMLDKVAQPVEDVPRAAMYIDNLLKAGEKGVPFDKAHLQAVRTTRRFLGDPTGKNITEFERNIIPLVVPFYRWNRHNIPLQMQLLAQEPGRFGALARAYSGRYDAYEGKIDPENIPDWLKTNVGIPVANHRNENGDLVVSFWTTAGWIPASDLGQLASILNPPEGSGIAKEASYYALSQVNPWAKAMYEDTINFDSYMRRKIDEGQTEEMFGMPLDPTVAQIGRAHV